jgi:hypothetical protein
MSQSRSLIERLILEKENFKEMNERSVTSQKINHSLIAKVGEQAEVCRFSA